MKKVLMIAIVVFMSSTVYAGEKLTACGGLAYPPFMWKEGGKIVGVGTEVAEIIFGELGIQVESKAFSSWNRCLQEVKKGRTDMLVAAAVNKERKAFADFTKNCLSEVPLAVFVWKDRAFRFEKWEDLIGKKMGGILGSSYGQKFDEFAAKNLKISEVVTPIQNFKKLEKGRVDFLPVGLYAGLIHVKQFGYADKVAVLKPYLKTECLYVAMSKKSEYLKHLPYVGRRLLKLHADGTIKRLIDKYIEYYVTTTE